MIKPQEIARILDEPFTAIAAKVDELLNLCDTIKAQLQSAKSTQQTLTDTIVQQAPK